MDGPYDLRQMTEALLRFRSERDWKQFHNPKDQMLSLTLEATELLELAQWKNGDELQAHLDEHKRDVADELVDVLGWVLLIANDQGIDLADAFASKQLRNAEKYPVEQSKGRAEKYTRLTTEEANR